MKTIAIIDDDVHIGNMIEEVLKSENYAVLRAYSGNKLSQAKEELLSAESSFIITILTLHLPLVFNVILFSIQYHLNVQNVKQTKRYVVLNSVLQKQRLLLDRLHRR